MEGPGASKMYIAYARDSMNSHSSMKALLIQMNEYDGSRARGAGRKEQEERG